MLNCRPAALPATGACLSGEARQIYQHLLSTIESLIEQGVTEFYCGGALGFDILAGEAVVTLRQTYPDIRLCMVLPCRDQDALWKEKDRLRYRALLDRADEITYIAETYSPHCMMQRNRRLVDASDVCLCYLTRGSGGTFYTVKHAVQKGISVINLAEDKDSVLPPTLPRNDVRFRSSFFYCPGASYGV